MENFDSSMCGGISFCNISFVVISSVEAPAESRSSFARSPFDACAAFCADWDQVAFDPGYESLPLETFEPMVREVFAREPKSFI